MFGRCLSSHVLSDLRTEFCLCNPGSGPPFPRNPDVEISPSRSALHTARQLTEERNCPDSIVYVRVSIYFTIR